MKKIALLFIIALSLTLAASVTAYAAEANDFASLSSALNATAVAGETRDTPTIVVVTDDITVTGQIDVRGFKTLVSDANNRTVTKGGTGEFNVFSIANGFALTIGTTDEPYGSLTLDGNGSGKAFSILSGGALTVNSGLITDWHSATDGGAITSAGTITINGGTIEKCTSALAGGVIKMTGTGTVTINGGMIKECSAGTNGGVICNFGTPGIITMNGGTITSCTAGTGGAATSGGGVFQFGDHNGLRLYLYGGTISNCSAPVGGVYFGSGNNNGTCVISNFNIENCTATVSTGGVFSVKTLALTVSNSTIKDCSALTLGGMLFNSANNSVVRLQTGTAIENCTAGNGATGSGGAFYMSQSGSRLYLEPGSIIKDCSATSGGAIATGSGTPVEINGGTITNCEASLNDGGAIYASGPVAFNSGEISDCSAGRSGGAIYISLATSTTTVNGGIIKNCSAVTNGSVIYSGAGNVTLNGGIIKNSAPTSGSAIYLAGAQILSLNGGIIINCGVNTIDSKSGAVNFGPYFKLPAPQRISFSNNNAVTVNEDIAIPGCVAIIKPYNAASVALKGAAFANNLDHFTLVVGETLGTANDSGIFTAEGTIPEEAAPVIALNYDSANNKVTVPSNQNTCGTLLAAAYYKNGKLADCRIIEDIYVAKAVDTEIQLPVDYIKPEGGTIKIMLWDSMNNIKPLSEAYNN